MKAFRFTYLQTIAAALFMPAAPQSLTAKPEAAGLSTARLERMDTFMSRLQAQGKLAGAVTVAARRGQVVSFKAYGFGDLESKRPMRVDISCISSR
jgi:CubicO group peptidase (beta-lactamase class C family)